MSKLHESVIRKLHPTQITVGIIEVADKCIELASLKAHERREFLSRHPIPAVLGPEEKLYITDHHHLARAAWDEGIETGFFIVEADFSKLDAAEFWREMTSNRWVHPIDGSGKKRPIGELPRHLDGLSDDIYRSLAGYVRNAGGYDKTPTAFAEFMWADFFRKRVVIGRTRADFERAVQQAYALARSPAARKLPGYRGS